MALCQLLCTAFFLLAARVYADSCVSKPCGSDYRVTSWNPVREGYDLVYYYEVKTDGCAGVVFTDVLLKTSLTCQDCATISCYNSYWKEVRCPYPPQWVTTDAFLRSKGVSDPSGVKFTLPRSTVLRFSINVNPSTTTSAYGKIYTKGNSWASCSVITPVCRCNVCPPCPGSCYRPTYQTYPACNCNNCSVCVNGTYRVSQCDSDSDTVCANCTQCVTNRTYESVPCTSTQNRVCKACTNCYGQMYESRTCTPTQDRICKDCTRCVTNMTYETIPCTTGGGNRVCANCSQCVTNMTYEVLPCTVTRDRQCANCTECVTNMTYQVVPCTGTRNRQCANCTVCVAGQYENRTCTTTQNRQCKNCTQCVSNMTYETVPCTGVSDRQCTNCTICQDGFYQVAPCNATSDRVCQQCSNCSANEQPLFPCNATHDVVCVPCPSCANCSNIPNSHLANNGLNCACNEGYTETPAPDGNFTCEPTPCCADCQSCGFNRSFPCINHNPDLCNYTCNYDDTCTLGRTPFDTGYTVVYDGRTEDAACCGATGGDCSCFSYNLSSSSFPLDDFVLGVNCPTLQQCDGLAPPPCLQTILRDGVDGVVVFGIPGIPNPYTNVTGIAVTGLNLNQDSTTLTFYFQGHINESSIPITFSAGTQSSTSEDRTCLISSLTGPDCVDCSTNPTSVFAVRTLQMYQPKHSANGRKISA